MEHKDELLNLSEEMDTLQKRVDSGRCQGTDVQRLRNYLLKYLMLENMDFLKEAQATVGGVYIAIIEEDNYYNVEVEVNEGTIAFTYNMAYTVEEAREKADLLEKMLKGYDVSVFKTRDSWEENLNNMVGLS